MARTWDPEAGYTQELYKFEQRPSVITATMQGSGKAGFGSLEGGRPFKFVPFPQMLYKARRRNGDLMCIDPQDEAWSNANYTTANDEAERSRLMEMGWRESQKDAVDFVISREQATRTAAAEEAYVHSKMGEKAQAEVHKASVDAANKGQHLVEVKETPIKPKRAYVRKAKPAVEA